MERYIWLVPRPVIPAEWLCKTYKVREIVMFEGILRIPFITTQYEVDIFASDKSW